MERYGQQVKNTIVTRFMSRHHATIKEKKIGGPGLKVSETDPKEGDKIKSIQRGALQETQILWLMSKVFQLSILHGRSSCMTTYWACLRSRFL